MASSNQGEVWDEVECMLSSMGVSSDTMAMADAFVQRTEDLYSFVAKLPCPEDAIGVFVAVNGKFRALDLFDRPSTLQQVWTRLVTSYATEALARRQSPDVETPTLDEADLLRRLGQTECATYPGVDLGEDWRFDSADTVGSALVAEGTAVHLSAFPGKR
jgi:hypothetical protein